MKQFKMLFLGPLGVGKSTAIAAVSDHAPVTTEAASQESQRADKTTTTVAMDYGEVVLDQDNVLLLYGVPGQDRFDFMWDVLAQGAMGAIVLLDARDPARASQLQRYIEVVRPLAETGRVAVGLGWSDDESALDALRAQLAEAGYCLPVFAVDVRRRDDVLLLLEVLISAAELA